jgi:hypothetical protein
MFRPGQRDQNAHFRGRAAIQEPERRDVIDPDDIQSCFPHLHKIALDLIARAEVMPFRVRFERPVGDALHEEFSIAFEEKFRDRANRARGSGTHSGSLIVQAMRRRKDLELLTQGAAASRPPNQPTAVCKPPLLEATQLRIV